MAIAKLVNIIEDNGTMVDEKAAYKSYLREKGQVRLSWAVFDQDQYRDKVTVDDKDLEGLYEKEKSTLRSENSLHLLYVVIDEKSGLRDDRVYMDLLKSKDMSAYGKSKGLEVVDLGTHKRERHRLEVRRTQDPGRAQRHGSRANLVCPLGRRTSRSSSR